MTARVDTQAAKQRAEWWLSQDPIWRRERGFGYATGFAETTLALAGLLADAEKALDAAREVQKDAWHSGSHAPYVVRADVMLGLRAALAAFDAEGGAGE